MKQYIGKLFSLMVDIVLTLWHCFVSIYLELSSDFEHICLVLTIIGNIFIVLFWANHFPKHFVYINSFNSHNNLRRHIHNSYLEEEKQRTPKC